MANERVYQRRIRIRRLLSVLLLGAALQLLLVAKPAFASHVVEWSLGSNCHAQDLTGSAQARGSVGFSACVNLQGRPLPNFPMFAQIQHPNGSTEQRTFGTDAQGNLKFSVTPKGTGRLRVQLCDQDGCHGTSTVNVTGPPVTQTSQPPVTTPGETVVSSPTPTPSFPTTSERPPTHPTITERPPTCWWCWGIKLVFVLNLLCVLFITVIRQRWWIWWLWWLLLIFIWIPFLLAGLIFFHPWWWWAPLLIWFPVIGSVWWFWCRRQPWWRPWWWFWPLAWSGLLVYGLFVWRPVWWFLLPVAWGPWVLFWLWARALRAPWWRWWWGIPIAGYVFWFFAWVVWVGPLWWWAAAVWAVPILLWWWWTKERTWSVIGPKLCFVKGWILLPPLVFAFTLYCVK